MNDSSLEVDLLYVRNDDEEEEERSFVRIPPSESRTQQTFAGHKWRCRSRPDGTLLVTVACGDADLFVTDLSPELGEPRRGGGGPTVPIWSEHLRCGRRRPFSLPVMRRRARGARWHEAQPRL